MMPTYAAAAPIAAALKKQNCPTRRRLLRPRWRHRKRTGHRPTCSPCSRSRRPCRRSRNRPSQPLRCRFAACKRTASPTRGRPSSTLGMHVHSGPEPHTVPGEGRGPCSRHASGCSCRSPRKCQRRNLQDESDSRCNLSHPGSDTMHNASRPRTPPEAKPGQGSSRECTR